MTTGIPRSCGPLNEPGRDVANTLPLPQVVRRSDDEAACRMPGAEPACPAGVAVEGALRSASEAARLHGLSPAQVEQALDGTYRFRRILADAGRREAQIDAQDAAVVLGALLNAACRTLGLPEPAEV